MQAKKKKSRTFSPKATSNVNDNRKTRIGMGSGECSRQTLPKMSTP